jgi:uncharacterized protein YqhQ
MTENQQLEDIKTDPVHIPDNSCSKKSNGRRTTIGGQALIEGLIMFGPKKASLAVRKADGSIHVEDFRRTLTGGIQDKIPVVRGCVRFFRQIVAGMGALMRSADLSEMDAETEKKTDSDHSASESKETTPTTESGTIEVPEPAAFEALTAPEPTAPSDSKPEKKSRIDDFLERHEKGAMVVTAGVSVLLSVAVFILLPRWLVDIVRSFIPRDNADSIGLQLIENLAEGVLRIAIFITYLALTSRMKEIARVWMYHGAEHKTIRCYEANEPLTVENIRKYSTRHPRCGTAFLFIVMLVSIITFSIVGALLLPIIGESTWWLNSIIRLALVPLVGGISYEMLRLTGKIDNTAIGRILTKPGMWLQRFTTREPDDSMLEVAIAAMNAVIPEKEGEDNL